MVVVWIFLIFVRLSYVTLYSTLYHLYNLKNLKNTPGEVLLLEELICIYIVNIYIL